MHILTVVVTRNVAISVKTLHTLLNINRIIAHNQCNNEIMFVDDDLSDRNTLLLKKMKHFDRIVWIDYSINIDHPSIAKLYEKFLQGYNCVVFPCVTPGIDWDMFKTKVLANSKEPVSQMGLNFDTEVGKCIGENAYIVTETNPKCWAIDTKPVLKALRDKKGDGLSIPVKVSDMFTKFIERGVKVYAYTDAMLTVTYPHECLGNILETAGVGYAPA